MIYTNIKLQGATTRFEDFVKLHEGRKTTPNQQKLHGRSSDSSRPRLHTGNPLTLVKSFWT
jgi:hypothetical protein